MNSNARLSIVIITRDRQHDLCKTLAALCQLPEQPPIIVVDNGSSDASVARARMFPSVTVIEAGENLGADARRIGLCYARTPYVAFADDDVIWRAGSLARAVALLDQFPQVALLTAKVLVGENQEVDPICLEMAASPLRADGDVPGPCLIGFLAGASVVRRDAVLPAMEAVPRRLLIGGEEEWIAVNILAGGRHICYISELLASHYPSPVRNAAQRRRLQLRNAIWFAFLRRPVRSAMRRTLAIAASEPRDWFSVMACMLALAELPWLLHERQVVPPNIEAMLQLVDRFDRHTFSTDRLPRMDAPRCSMPSPLPEATCQPGHSA